MEVITKDETILVSHLVTKWWSQIDLTSIKKIKPILYIEVVVHQHVTTDADYGTEMGVYVVNHTTDTQPKMHDTKTQAEAVRDSSIDSSIERENILFTSK